MNLLDVFNKLAATLMIWSESSVAIAMARRSGFESRMRAILDAGVNRKPLARWASALLAVVVLGICAPVAMMRAEEADKMEEQATAAPAEPGAESTSQEKLGADPQPAAEPAERYTVEARFSRTVDGQTEWLSSPVVYLAREGPTTLTLRGQDDLSVEVKVALLSAAEAADLKKAVDQIRKQRQTVLEDEATAQPAEPINDEALYRTECRVYQGETILLAPRITQSVGLPAQATVNVDDKLISLSVLVRRVEQAADNDAPTKQFYDVREFSGHLIARGFRNPYETLSQLIKYSLQKDGRPPVVDLVIVDGDMVVEATNDTHRAIHSLFRNWRSWLAFRPDGLVRDEETERTFPALDENPPPNWSPPTTDPPAQP